MIISESRIRAERHEIVTLQLPIILLRVDLGTPYLQISYYLG
jgi:hypothetical protein